MGSETLMAIIMGVVQGITEFFPVSSTAHLILFPWFFGWEGEVNSLTFNVALHSGTLIALIVIFYKDWLNMLLKNRQMLYLIIIATIPTGLAGVLLNNLIENSLRSPLVIIASLTLIGMFMLKAESYSKKSSSDETKDSHEFQPAGFKHNPTLYDAILIGIAQAIALIPGVSRSGITISAGLFRNLSREASARFSFLLSTPVIAGATILEGRKLIQNPESYNIEMFSIGLISAFIAGFFAIKFLLNFLKKYPLNVFVYYRFLLAGIILIAYYLK